MIILITHLCKIIIRNQIVFQFYKIIKHAHLLVKLYDPKKLSITLPVSAIQSAFADNNSSGFLSSPFLIKLVYSLINKSNPI